MKKFTKTEVTDDNELTDKGQDAVPKQKDELELSEEASCKAKDAVPTLCEQLEQMQLSDGAHNTNYDYSPSVIDMPAGSYNIVMIVDANEHELSGHKVKNSETRSLNVGSVIWVAQNNSTSTELVLPYIVARKKFDDIVPSLRDGSLKKQNLKLRKCGLGKVIILVEDQGDKHNDLSQVTSRQALANIRVHDGFMVHYTDSLKCSKRFLKIMTDKLTNEMEGVNLSSEMKPPASDVRCLMTFESFNADSTKQKPMKCKDIFITMLLQIEGMSLEKARAITKVYGTPKALDDAYEDCDDAREGELLLANLRLKSNSPRVGPALSKIVYMLFHNKNF